MTLERGSKFELLQVGRAVAALLVVLLHTQNIMGEARFFGVEPLGRYAANLNVGVDFFFVLSGFIIAWVHWDDFGMPQRIPNYARKRFLRIFPPYWGILLPLTALYLLFPEAGSASKHDPLNIVLSTFLVPYAEQPVLGVAWTLTHEIFFYLLFGFIIGVGRRALWILPAWTLMIVAGSFVPDLRYPFTFLLSAFNLEFIMGVSAAFILRRYTILVPWLVLTVGCGVFAAFMLFAPHIQENGLRGRLVFGIPAMLFVLASVEIERRRPVRLSRFALLLGAASYSIYLVHPVALSFAANAMAYLHLLTSLPVPVALASMFTFSVAVGTFYALAAEPRLIKAAGQLLRSFPKLFALVGPREQREADN